MADARTRLEYLASGTTWTKADADIGATGSAVTLGTGANAVIRLSILQKLNNPSTAKVSLSNKSPGPTSSTGSVAKGRLTDVFTPFMQCRLIEEETGLCLFRGRIYRSAEKRDATYGSIIELDLQDALAELAAFPMEAGPSTLAAVDIYATAQDKRSELIPYIIAQLGMSGNILAGAGTADSVLVEESFQTFGATAAQTFDCTSSNQSALQLIYELAQTDPDVAGVTTSTTAGWDYYLDTNTISNSATSVTIPNLNYFPRTTRPGPDRNNRSFPSKNSLTFELPADDWAGETGFRRAMMSPEFSRPNEERYSSVILTYQESNASNTKATSTEGVQKSIEFERLSGTITGSFANSYPAAKNKYLNIKDTLYTEHPDKLYISGNAAAVATVQAQSGTGANQFLILSDISTDFPTSGSAVELWAASDGSGSKIVFHAINDRPSKSFGVQRPARIKRNNITQYDKLRLDVITHLTKSTVEIIRGQFSTLKYPYFSIESPGANATLTTANQIDFATPGGGVAAFVNGLASDSTRTNDVRTFGVKVGMVVAEVDTANTQALKRYAYISTITQSGTRITYGASASDTSDGISLNPNNGLKIFIPLRPGDMVYTLNKMSNVVSNQLIVGMEHEEGVGVSLSTLQTIGNNTASADKLDNSGIGTPPSSTAAFLNETKPVLPGTTNKGTLPWLFSTEIAATASNVISWGHVSGGLNILTIGNDTEIRITDGTSGTLANGTHVMYYRTGTAFSFATAAGYVPDKDDVLIGWVEARAAGTATIKFNGAGVIGSPDKYEATEVIIPDTTTSALLKKGARAYQTDLRLFPGMVSLVAGSVVNDSSDPVDVQITSTADAAKFHVSNGGGPAYIQIDDEILKVGTTTDSDAILEGCVRAQKGTTIAEHAVGATVFQTQQYSVGGSGHAVLSAYKELADKQASNPATAAGVRFADATGSDSFTITAVSQALAYNTSAANVVGTAGTAFAANTTYYLYCSIPTDTTAQALKASPNFYDAYADDTLFLGLMVTGKPKLSSGALVDTAGASFFMDKSKESTISTSLLAANAIVADSITSNALDTHTITLASGGKFVTTANMERPGTSLWSTGAGGILIDSVGILGTSGADTDIASTEFYIQASDGRAYFGGGLVKADKTGLTIGLSAGDSSTGFIRWLAPDVSNAFIFRAQATDSDYQKGNIVFQAPQDLLMFGSILGNMSVGNPVSDIGNAPGSSPVHRPFRDIFTKHIKHTPAVASGSVPTESYGTFRYALDGGGASVNTLGFLSGQTNATPNLENAGSTFWAMLSESDGSSGSRLLFEPIVPWGSSDGTKNNAYIGFHNFIVGIQSHYFYAKNSSASYPAFSFIDDPNTGFYRSSADIISVALGGNQRYSFTGTYFRPEDDDATDLGHSAKRWDDVYATNGTIQTSDMRDKTQILPTTLGLKFINALNPVTYKWKTKVDAPTHHGLIAQEVIGTLKEYGIESRDEFGGITGNEDTRYGARYTEFVPILIKAVQELTEKIKKLEEER